MQEKIRDTCVSLVCLRSAWFFHTSKACVCHSVLGVIMNGSGDVVSSAVSNSSVSDDKTKKATASAKRKRLPLLSIKRA